MLYKWVVTVRREGEILPDRLTGLLESGEAMKVASGRRDRRFQLRERFLGVANALEDVPCCRSRAATVALGSGRHRGIGRGP